MSDTTSGPGPRWRARRTAGARVRVLASAGAAIAAIFLALAEPGAQSPTPVPAPLTADDLFDPTLVHDLQLTVNTRDWADLKAHYRENVYYPADLRWRGEVVRNVGIRSRGLGSRSGTKPGLRVDFDRYATTQEFLGLKSLVLDNMTQDPALLKERIVMRFFNEMGIPAPRVVHARLFVNNQFAGLYTIVESIDKRFLKRAFDENDGYLYEFHYTDRYGFEYLGDQLERYAEFFEAKTHERDGMAVLYRPIREMAWAISESPDSMFVSSTNQYLDIRAFLSYVAVEKFLADRDGMLGDWGMNNFYLYRFENRQVSQIVPWDKDSSFWGNDYDIWGNAETNALMRRALMEGPLRSAYVAALRRCAELAMSPVKGKTPEDAPAAGDPGTPKPRWLEAQIQYVYEQIHAAALADTAKPFANERFEDEMAKILEFARVRSAYVLHEIGVQ